MSIVLLEHLPTTFTEATLNSIITHVPCKGKILNTNLVPDGESLSAHVHFERPEDADAAVRLWDQLTIDSTVITASSEADTKRKLTRNVNAQHNSGLRYPFAPMNIGWLYEFVNTHKSPERGYTMCLLLECLMCNAVTTSDPYMEHAVVHFYTKFTCSAWTRAQGQRQDGVTFEYCRQVFEVIGLIRRYPSANTKSRKMLLTLVERVVEDISKIAITSKPEAINKAIPEVISSVRSCIAALRNSKASIAEGGGNTGPGTPTSAGSTMEAQLAVAATSEGNLASLMSWLKFLFTCLSSHHTHAPTAPETPAIVPCSDTCSCFAKLKSSYPVIMADIEKVKVIDALVVMAGRDTTDGISGIARDLLQHYNIDFCARAVAHIRNGQFAILRLYAFDALRFAKRLQTQPSSAPVTKALDLIEIALLTAIDTCGDHPTLLSFVVVAGDGLRLLSVIRIAVDRGGEEPLQHYFTLYFTLQTLFTALCSPQLILCVHEADQPDAGTGGASLAPTNIASSKEQFLARQQLTGGGGTGDVGLDVKGSLHDAAEITKPLLPRKDRCGNPDCTSGREGADLLKCSACKSVYYCSQACQRSDWKNHRNVCKSATQGIKTTPLATIPQGGQTPAVATPATTTTTTTAPAVASAKPLPPPLPAPTADANVRRICSVALSPMMSTYDYLTTAVQLSS